MIIKCSDISIIFPRVLLLQILLFHKRHIIYPDKFLWCPAFLRKGFFYQVTFQVLFRHTPFLLQHHIHHLFALSYVFLSFFPFCLIKLVLLWQGYFSRPRNNSFVSDLWCTLPHPRKDFYLKATPDHTLKEKTRRFRHSLTLQLPYIFK